MEKIDQIEKKEQRVKGLPASPGIAMGELCIYKRKKIVARPFRLTESQAQSHLDRFYSAKNAVVRDLDMIQQKTDDEEAASIIGTQKEIVNDPDLENSITRLIDDKLCNVDYAIYRAFRNYINIIESSDNSVLKERVIDIEDIRDKMIQVVQRMSPSFSLNTPLVITDELTPTEIVQFSDKELQGLVMDKGGLTSHTSIIAHSMGIPTVVATKRMVQLANEGDFIIIDGNRGLCILNPDEETVQEYEVKIQEQEAERQHLDKILAKPSETKCGTPFKLRANMEFEQEVSNIERYNATGIGLLRTESMYISRGHFEDIPTQEQFYEHFLRSVEGRSVNVRLFDAGGDKLVEKPYKEDNPFLGWRGIRMLLHERELLTDQLRAIHSVAGRFPGQIKIMIPMVTTIDEVKEVQKINKEVRQELLGEGVSLDADIKLGIMVEVPSVAVQADVYADYVDFFSIGTNDLTQYTLAVDRGNEMVSHLYQQRHPSIWKLISLTAEAANSTDTPVAVCGELASDPVSAACLLGLGITDLSMAPSAIPMVKNVLINKTMEEMQELAHNVLQSENNAEIEELFEHWKNQKIDNG